MKKTQHHFKMTDPRTAGSAIFRTVFGITAVLFILAVVGVIFWRHKPALEPTDPYARIPFRPEVRYDSSNIFITNTESEPYLDVSLRVYVGSTLYKVDIGTIEPGGTKTCSLMSLTNNVGESFQPGSPKISELEVRARFGGHDDHKDFPPPQ